MSDGAGNRTWTDEVEALEREKRPARKIIDDGRAPDALTGLPMETDAELRTRLRYPLALLPTEIQLQRLRELQGKPMALWEYVRNVVVEACAKKCEALDSGGNYPAGNMQEFCALVVRELAAPLVVQAEGHYDGPNTLPATLTKQR